MCMKLEGEVRGVRSITTKKNNKIEILTMLAMIGKSERIVEIANFSDTEIKKGPCQLSIVPRVAVSNGRGFLNLATYDGVVK